MFMTFKNQNGVALVAALLILLALSTIGTVAAFTTVTDIQISGNVRDIKQAFYLAEAGVSHAGDFLDQATAAEWTSYATLQPLIADTTLGGGNYTATIEDAGGDMRRVISTGSTDIGGYTEIEAIFSDLLWSPQSAILTGGDLDMPGNPTVSGACGSVHSNKYLTIEGSPIIGLTATASETALATGNPTVDGVHINTTELKDQYGEESSGNLPQKITEVKPTNFYDLGSMSFDYTLKCSGPDAGMFVDGDGFSSPPPPLSGWEFGGDKWVISDNSAANLNVKVDCEVNISGSPGSDASPWNSTIYVDGVFEISGSPTMEQVTVIATGDVKLSGNLEGPSSEGGTAETTVIAGGNIEISGNPDIKSPTSGDFESLLFIAGKDLKINGTPSQYFEGIMAAHEQIEVSGNPNVTGFLLAEDAENISTLVDNNYVGGNMNITYNCGLTHVGLRILEMVSWRQL